LPLCEDVPACEQMHIWYHLVFAYHLHMLASTERPSLPSYPWPVAQARSYESFFISFHSMSGGPHTLCSHIYLGSPGTLEYRNTQ
jgi:hypothetical protein